MSHSVLVHGPARLAHELQWPRSLVRQVGSWARASWPARQSAWLISQSGLARGPGRSGWFASEVASLISQSGWLMGQSVLAHEPIRLAHEGGCPGSWVSQVGP